MRWPSAPPGSPEHGMAQSPGKTRSRITARPPFECPSPDQPTDRLCCPFFFFFIERLFLNVGGDFHNSAVGPLTASKNTAMGRKV